ncbi:MAG: ABC transporter ATP-binding protein [bacterium]|nr:ABC transporter ATP-binding protein [bacterium]
MSVLTFDGICRAYTKDRPVLNGVDFSIDRGEVVGLLGKNGAGKTTLMRIAMGMIHPQSGSVRVFGMDPWLEPVAIKRRLGYVAEDQVLPEHFTVTQVIDIHRTLFPTWDEALERDLKQRFQLDYGVKIKNLSKGQARQVALLSAIAHRPELLLLDEPAGGLDPAARREFLETAIRLLAESGATILFSSHHMADVERVASRVVMLEGAQVLIDSALDTLRESHCLTVVPRTAEVDASRISAIDGCLRVRRRPGALHAVFRSEPEAARALLATELGITDAVSTRVPLEDLFVELVGGDS